LNKIKAEGRPTEKIIKISIQLQHEHNYDLQMESHLNNVYNLNN